MTRTPLYPFTSTLRYSCSCVRWMGDVRSDGVMRRTVGLLALLAVACSSDHPPFVGGDINGGTQGTSQAGTSGEAPSDGAAGERAAGSSGRTGSGGNSGRA